MMVKIDPKIYRKHIFVGKKGDPMLYLCLNKTLYGLLKSVLYFFKKLVGELKEMGFELNPYDPCVANKTINGSQMTVTWHVDDLKVPHVESIEVTKFILSMAKIYGPNITV